MTQIYIYILADYNAGRMIGEWVDLTDMTQQQLNEKIEDILKQSQETYAEEVDIADYEGFYGLNPSLYNIIEVAERIQEHGEAYAKFAQDRGENLVDLDEFEEAYCGKHDSFLDYATELFDDCYAFEIPENLRYYIDYEKFARDLLYGGEYWTEKCETGGVHVFRAV